jgi:uncharacterized protein YecE (DUF72 family)
MAESRAAGKPAPSAAATRIRVGVGGWTYPPWRGSFYPKGLPQTQELAHASRRLTAIEVNGTFYGSFKPATFRKWRDETPDGFVFTLKAPRFAVNRRELATAGDAIARFVDSGIGELGSKLGPILWQLAPGKAFDAGELGAFLALLPARDGSRPLRHALEVRHASFRTPECVLIARAHDVALVFTDSDDHPSFADATADFIYARLMRCEAKHAHGYAPKALDAWAGVARAWAAGGAPDTLPYVVPPVTSAPRLGRERDVFVFFINGAKEQAPAAALALIERLG